MDSEEQVEDLGWVRYKLALTAKEVGQLLGVTEDCVKNLHYRKKTLRGVLIGASLRFLLDDVRRFVRELGHHS